MQFIENYTSIKVSFYFNQNAIVEWDAWCMGWKCLLFYAQTDWNKRYIFICSLNICSGILIKCVIELVITSSLWELLLLSKSSDSVNCTDTYLCYYATLRYDRFASIATMNRWAYNKSPIQLHALLCKSSTHFVIF